MAIAFNTPKMLSLKHKNKQNDPAEKNDSKNFEKNNYSNIS